MIDGADFVLVFAAIIAGSFGGVTGAILGGAAGNTITDGLGGFFEGYVSEKLSARKIKNHRTALSSSLGKTLRSILLSLVDQIAVSLS